MEPLGQQDCLAAKSLLVMAVEFAGKQVRKHVEQRPAQTIIHGLPAQAPDELVSVVKLELDGPPDQDISRVIGAADIFPNLPP